MQNLSVAGIAVAIVLGTLATTRTLALAEDYALSTPVEVGEKYSILEGAPICDSLPHLQFAQALPKTSTRKTPPNGCFFAPKQSRILVVDKNVAAVKVRLTRTSDGTDQPAGWTDAANLNSGFDVVHGFDPPTDQ
ncbi:MAG: hypothetical protein IVW54_21540 [Candidatus Binataceae bacterium]|nr:hypothetical protein [Candidatus Binataceae bacterium]